MVRRKRVAIDQLMARGTARARAHVPPFESGGGGPIRRGTSVVTRSQAARHASLVRATTVMPCFIEAAQTTRALMDPTNHTRARQLKQKDNQLL
jgi:hypothetical protein